MSASKPLLHNRKEEDGDLYPMVVIVGAGSILVD